MSTEKTSAAPADAVVRRQLRVFVVNDDPNGDCLPDESWWAAIAAEDQRQALAIASATYDGNGPLDEYSFDEFFKVDREVDSSRWHERFKPTAPQRLTCCESLRQCGFREDGETACDSCGLAAMAMPAYRVCEDCQTCNECGGCQCEKTYVRRTLR